MPPFFALEGRNHSTNPQPTGEDWFIFKLYPWSVLMNEAGNQVLKPKTITLYR